jgi:hypothetical protein
VMTTAFMRLWVDEAEWEGEDIFPSVDHDLNLYLA